MPQATDAQRLEWNGPEDATAMKYLDDAGYSLTSKWQWRPPQGHTPTAKEISAIQFLINEWDFGGLVRE